MLIKIILCVLPLFIPVLTTKWTAAVGQAAGKFYPKLPQGMENIDWSLGCEQEQSMVAGCVSFLGMLLKGHSWSELGAQTQVSQPLYLLGLVFSSELQLYLAKKLSLLPQVLSAPTGS